MATFTVRVELHQSDDGDYDTLHEAMEDEGFSRTITVVGKGILKLPTAEYSIVRKATITAVMLKARRAAVKVRPKYAVLVTEVVKRESFGLKKA